MRLYGKRAIVTGGASGFGAGIAAKFVAEGASVIIADIDATAAQAVADAMSNTHDRYRDEHGNNARAVHAFAVDVAVNKSMAALAAFARETFGEVDILVNNAGITHLPDMMEAIDEAEFDHVLAVNAKSVYLSARHFVPAMRARRAGVILNIASTAGVSPRPRLAWYNASKGWMITATRSMAIELAPHGVRVNALNPVAGETPLLKSFMGEDTPEIRARFLSTIPLGRFSTPEDLGNAACFLCSDEASMITGVALEVDGGRCI